MRRLRHRCGNMTATSATLCPMPSRTPHAASKPFPPGFVWGAATSSYQIEGATRADGRTDSIWDVFAARGGTFQSQSGEPACDHYHRFEEDVALMRQMGLKAYRFSIAWPRVQPNGPESVSSAGLGFYDRLVDALLKAGIEPYVTLYHWDMPQWLSLRGGLLNREFVGFFGTYAEAVVDRLSDRVSQWMTINEPQVFCKFGYADGTNAPGYKLSLGEQLQTVHVALMSHGRACQVIRARAKKKPTVGWALVGKTDFPVGACANGERDTPSLPSGPLDFIPPTPEDVEAARRSMMSVTAREIWNNTLYADPVVFGHYPEDALRVYAPDKPDIRPGDMELIKQPLDFYGVNIYDGRAVRAGPGGASDPRVVPFDLGHPQTLCKWFIAPPALRYGPRFLYERYKVPVYIAENGISCTDWLQQDGRTNEGRVDDPQRIDYTRRYLRQLRLAIDDGADIRGYFHWSLLDNFEWGEGYQQRFGLIHVDMPTGKRTPKASSVWYRGVIETNGVSL